MNDTKLFPDWCTEQQLESRENIIYAVYMIVSIVSLIAAQYWCFGYSDQPIAPENEKLFDKGWGVLYGFGFASSGLIMFTISWMVYFLIRIVYYLQGYDLPDAYDLDKQNLSIKSSYAYAMMTEKTYELPWLANVCTVAVYLCVYLLQLLLGALWQWDPIAILLPLAVASPIVVAVLFRKRNRKVKLETKQILHNLSR
jgi:hypothetical protein